MLPAQEASLRSRRELVGDGGRENGMFRGSARGESMLSLLEIVMSSDGEASHPRYWQGQGNTCSDGPKQRMHDIGRAKTASGPVRKPRIEWEWLQTGWGGGRGGRRPFGRRRCRYEPEKEVVRGSKRKPLVPGVLSIARSCLSGTPWPLASKLSPRRWVEHGISETAQSLSRRNGLERAPSRVFIYL